MTDTLAQLYQAFGVLVALLVAATAAARAVRLRRERRRERAAAAPRRRLLAFVAEPDDAGAAELVALSEAQWRAVAPVALPLLGKLRGDAYAALADVFIRRGAAHTARRALRARSAVTRATAAQLLGDLRHTDAVPDLVAALDDRSGEVAVVAVRALGSIGDPAAAAPLLRALAHRALPAHLVARALADLGPAAAHALVDAIGPAAAHEVRATAVDALGMLGVPAAAAAVIDLLDDADAPVDVRVSAARALGELGTRSSLRPLQAALRPGLPVPLRVAAAAALGSVGAPAAAPALADLLHDPHYAVAHAAAAALRQVGAAGQRALRETTAGADLAAAHARESLALAELYRAARAQTVRG